MSDTNILSTGFLNAYKKKRVQWGFGDLGYIVFKRTYSRLLDDNNTTEEWYQTIARCINGAQRIGANYTKAEAERLFDYLFHLKGSFSGRALWQLNTPLVNDLNLMDSLVNCWGTKVSEIKDFSFLLMESFMGGGVGNNVAREYTQELPRVKRNVRCTFKNTKDADYIVPDSKEGWVRLWENLLNAYLITGKSFTYSTVCIRPAGDPIKTFGGIAPGPKPLIDGAASLCKILESREGKKLRTEDVADIICIAGEMVKSGGVRRTAIILAGDVDDISYLRLKRWDLGNIPNWRSNSNNSLLCPKYDYLQDSFWDGYNGNGEPYGLINLPLIRKYGRLGETEYEGFNLSNPDIICVNPCLPNFSTLITPQGMKKLGDVNIGDTIWSETGWTTVTNKWCNGIKAVYKYTTTAGIFYSTQDHKIVSHGEKLPVQVADTVDILAGPTTSSLPLELSPQDIMDGLVLGDGSIHKASNNLIILYIGNNDQDYFDSVIAPLISNARPGIADKVYTISTTLTEDDLGSTYQRTIPPRFLYGNHNTVCGFLRGLYSANGSICGQRITLKAASHDLIRNVQLMLSSVGIRSYITTNKPHMVQFANGQYQCKQSYDLNISIDRHIFHQKIGFLQQYKNQKLKQLLTLKSNKIKTNYDIISQEHISTELVYDITVDNETHTFWCDGWNVSNCGEATLEDKEACILSELNIARLSSKEEMLDLAKLLYKAQKAVAAGNYYHEDTNKIIHKNFRLGLSITGICARLDVVKEWSNYVYKHLRQFDKTYSKEMGYPQSIRLTTVQPSGTKSLLFGSPPGVHPGYSRYFIRRVRFDGKDPLLKILKEAGYPLEPERRFDGSLNHSLIVVSFPCQFDDHVLVSNDCSAIKQLELLQTMQTAWADQAVSATVYYRKEELPEIKAWLKQNYDNVVKSVSFLLHQDHNFAQAPYTPITEEEYKSLISKITPIVNQDIVGHDFNDSLECASGTCPVK